MMFSGITANNAVQVFKDFAAALPDAKLYGPGRRRRHRLRQHQGRHPGRGRGSARRSRSPRCPRTSTRRRARSSSRATRRSTARTNPSPYAIYGYEVMQLALDSIKRSQTGEKADVVKALFSTKDRSSVLGTYSIDANGDTSLTDYGVYAIKDGKLEFDKTIKAATS